MRRFAALLTALVALSVLTGGGGVARADAAQSLVDAGSSEAAARGTTAGIALLDRRTGRYTDNGPTAHQWFGSASLVKLFIADSVLRRARTGEIRLSDADRNSLGLMLRSSDDAAASSMWSRFGSSSIVTDVKARYGLAETAPPANPRYWGLTQVTARDLTTFYDGMLSGRGGLDGADRDFIVDQLRRATDRGTDGVYQWFGLHDGLPRDTVGVKQGWMCCFSDGYIWRHSTGLIGPDARYVVVVLARDEARQGAGHTEASTTRIVQRMFPAGLVPRVQGLIGELWYQLGGHTSLLGLPVTEDVPLRGGAFTFFERGAVYWSPPTGAHEVHGEVRAGYDRLGAENGILGYPTSNELPLNGGALGQFQGGYVYWSPPTGPHEVHGQVLAAYGRLGYERGLLGYPTSDEVRLRSGALGLFQGGYVYWSAPTGAHEVHGQVLAAYSRLGFENGFLGYPTSDELPLNGGALSRFQGGHVYWSAPTGAHEVHGEVLAAYGRLGYERGWLGYPTSDEISLYGGALGRFAGGSVYWSPATGGHALGGALLAAYTNSGAERGLLGYPTSDPYPVGTGTRVDFQHGSLTLTSSGEVVRADAPNPAATAVTPRTAPAPAPVPAPTSAPAPAPAPATVPAPLPSAPVVPAEPQTAGPAPVTTPTPLAVTPSVTPELPAPEPSPTTATP